MYVGCGLWVCRRVIPIGGRGTKLHGHLCHSLLAANSCVSNCIFDFLYLLYTLAIHQPHTIAELFHVRAFSVYANIA